MSGKQPSGIEKITLNAATFNNVVVEPTFINFFYGANGTGKTTIAEAIEGKSGLTFMQGKSFDDYSILVFNQNFIDRQFQSYGDLKGVYTIGEINIEIQNKVEELSQAKSKLDETVRDNNIEKGRKETALNSLWSSFQETCWTKTKTIRDFFDATQEKFKRKLQFAERVLQIANPTQHNLDELKTLYTTAYDANARTYPEFKALGGTTRLKGSSASELLSRPIVSRSDTPFASFMKAINATDWVLEWRERHADTEGKCPYCQRELPDDFEDEIAACFDSQYQQDLDDIKKFQADYESDMRGFVDVLKANLSDVLPALDLTAYNAKLADFENAIDKNIRLIADKVREPSSTVSLQNVKTLREEINAIIANLNKLIQEHNAVVSAKQKNQNECKTKVWELIAHILQNDVAAYKKSLSALNTELAALKKKMVLR